MNANDAPCLLDVLNCFLTLWCINLKSDYVPMFSLQSLLPKVATKSMNVIAYAMTKTFDMANHNVITWQIIERKHVRNYCY